MWASRTLVVKTSYNAADPTQHGGSQLMAGRRRWPPNDRLVYERERRAWSQEEAAGQADQLALRLGPTAHGFTGELWTLDRIAIVIERLTGIRYHPAWVWAVLHHRLGWSVQRPKRRAAERDQAAIDRWVKERWPRVLQTPNGAEPAWSSSTSPRSA
jgi:transposase